MSCEIGRLSLAGLAQFNDYMSTAGQSLWRDIQLIINKYGGVTEINRKAAEAGEVKNLMARLKSMDSPYLKDLEWLIEQQNKNAFVRISDYRRKHFGAAADMTYFQEASAVTLEISPVQYFPWLIAEAKRAIDKQDLMPGRFVRLRSMKEQENDNGDILATEAAMRILGASKVESLDSKGTDGSNVHLGGTDTLLGYFGGVGQPNDHVLMYVDEALYYYTQYGVRNVLNFNQGSVLAMHMLYQAGVNIKFKISVFMGNDNPYSALSVFMGCKAFQRPDGTTALDGLNLSNSVSTATIRAIAQMRRELGLEDKVRIEHHITEPLLGIVKHPYHRREQLLEIAGEIPNISAKHEGAEADSASNRKRPWSLMDNFRAKEDILAAGLMGDMEQNYLDKHDALNMTARALTERGFAFVAAANAHRR